MRTGTLKDPAMIQSANDRAQALAFIANRLVQLGAGSYLGAVDIEKLCETDLALLHKCFNVWRERIAEAVEVGRSF